MESAADQRVPDDTEEDSLKAEGKLEQYLDEGHMLEDPLEFYKQSNNPAHFKWCTMPARQIFSATATIARIERIFSSCGLL